MDGVTLLHIKELVAQTASEQLPLILEFTMGIKQTNQLKRLVAYQLRSTPSRSRQESKDGCSTKGQICMSSMMELCSRMDALGEIVGEAQSLGRERMCRHQVADQS